jgi:hypothetical protein
VSRNTLGTHTGLSDWLTGTGYVDAGFFNGIVRIGEFDGDVHAIERQSDDFSVTIERAE